MSGEVSDDLSGHFLRTARFELSTAMDVLGGRDDGVYVRFYLHAGLGLEFLLKAVLSRESPALIADDAKFETLYAFATAKSVQTLAALNARTAPLSETFERALVALPTLTPLAGVLREVIRRRNAVVHLGYCEEGGVEAHSAIVLKAVAVCLEVFDEDFARFMDEYADAASAILDESRTRMEAAVEAKIGRARRAFDERYGDSEMAAGFAAALHQEYWGLDAGGQPRECPACGTEAVALGEVEVREEIDYDREGPVGVYLVPEFYVGEFLCRACGLLLAGPELTAASIETRWELELTADDERSLYQEYFEPDEDHYRDR